MCVLYCFWSGQCYSRWQLQACVSGQGGKCFEFWGHAHPSQVNGMTEKCKDPFTFTAFGSGLFQNESACLESALILTLLRHDDTAFKYKAYEKLYIRIVQLSSLLEAKDAIFGGGIQEVSITLQIIHKKSGVNFDISRFLQ